MTGLQSCPDAIVPMGMTVVQNLIAALAAYSIPPDLMAEVTAALVLGDQAIRAQHRLRELAAERQRRKRAADADLSCHVKRHVTSRDAKKLPPHPPKENNTKTKNQGETIVDRIPEDWSPAADDRAHAAGMGLDVEAEAERFRRYWRSRGEWVGAYRKDWSEAWRYHCDQFGRRPSTRAATSNRSSGGASSPYHAIMRDNLHLLRERGRLEDAA